MATELMAFQVGSWQLEAAAPGGEQIILEEAGRVVSDEVDFNLKGSWSMHEKQIEQNINI